jgi:uncharacterized RDD family membrane protein YckC
MAENVFCSRCGTLNPPQASFCQKCGAGLGTNLGVTSPGAPVAVSAPRTFSAGYGGFWIRVVAAIIDAIALGIIALPIRMIIFAVGRVSGYRMGPNYDENLGRLLALIPLLIGANVLVSWLYEALMTSSSWQATLGKKALNLKVTDEAGNRISFARATGRHFAKYLSVAILFIGYIMVAFTERNRALHDMLAGTLVRKV